MRTTAAGLLLVLLLACGQAPKAVRVPAAPPAPPNLLELARGGAVVSRTGEAMLGASATRAIDGDYNTRWLSPPGAPRQTLVYSLAGRARITGVSFTTGSKPGVTTRKIQVEFSFDGRSFTDGGTFTLAGKAGAERFAVGPVEASFVRVTTLEANGPFAILAEVAVSGSWISPPQAATIDGCWSVNGNPASFATNGGLTDGYVGGNERTEVEGGSDGAFYRFAWIRGQEYGLAAVSVTNDGGHLSGIVWHEQAIETWMFLASDWLGVRAQTAGCAVNARQSPSVFRAYLQHVGYFPLYGLRFAADGTMNEAASEATLNRVTELLASPSQVPVRFVAHELRQSAPQQNLAVAQKEIASLRAALARRGVPDGRVSFVAVGQERPRREANTDLTRSMYSGIEIGLAR